MKETLKEFDLLYYAVVGVVCVFGPRIPREIGCNWASKESPKRLFIWYRADSKEISVAIDVIGLQGRAKNFL